MWHRNGGRPMPGGERGLTATKAACALASLLRKWGVVEIEGVTQYPSHLTSTLGVKIDLSRWTGALEMRSLSLFVRQGMSSILGSEKPTPSLAPLAFSLAYCFCKICILRR